MPDIVISDASSDGVDNLLRATKLDVVPFDGRMLLEIQASYHKDGPNTDHFAVTLTLGQDEAPLQEVLIPGNTTGHLALIEGQAFEYGFSVSKNDTVGIRVTEKDVDHEDFFVWRVTLSPGPTEPPIAMYEEEEAEDQE